MSTDAVDELKPKKLPATERALRWGLIGVSLFVVIFQCGGVLLGWPNLELVLKREGLFSSVCGKDLPKSKSCPARDAAFESISDTAFLALNLGNSVMGALLDLIGARKVAILGALCNAAANFSLSQLNVTTDGGLYKLMLSILAAAGFGPYLAAFKWAVYVKYRSLYASIIASLFNASALNYLVLYELNTAYGVTREQFFFLYGFLSLSAVVVALFLYPDDVGDGSEEVGIPVRKWLVACFAKSSSEGSEPLLADGVKEEDDDEPQQLVHEGPKWYEEARDPRFLYLMYFYAVNNLMANYTSSTIADQLQRLGDNGEYTRDFSLIANLVFIVFPLIGALMEKTGFELAFLICQLLGLASLLSWLYLPLHLMPLGFSTFAIFQGFLFPGFFAYLAVEFSMHNYGRLMAIATIVSTGAASANYGFTALALADKGSYYWPNMIQVILAIPALGFPVFLYFHRKSKAASAAEKEGYTSSVEDEELDRSRSVHIIPSVDEISMG